MSGLFFSRLNELLYVWMAGCRHGATNELCILAERPEEYRAVDTRKLAIVGDCACIFRRFGQRAEGMVHLKLAGPDTHATSTLCAACPYDAAGCCVAPPRYALSDIARVVGHGGTDWLLTELAAGNLVRVPAGLALSRRRAVSSDPQAKCVFHADALGCTLIPVQRPATCNYYLCDQALAHARTANSSAEIDATEIATRDLVASFVSWDQQLADYIDTEYPNGLVYDRQFFENLDRAFRKISAVLETSAQGAKPEIT